MRDMTSGDISGHILATAVPLILGNMMQLTYNAADSIIVSKFAGEEALDAVSVANPVMTFVILAISGLAIGATVLMSRLFGSGERARLKKALSTSVIAGAVLSLAVLVLGLLASGLMLRAMNVPEAILPQAELYLKTVFWGFLFTFQYNIMSGALRAIGDAAIPVWFLGASCLINVALDAFFVAGCRLGVFGAALATDIAEGVSAVLCFIYVYRHVPELQLRRADMAIDRGMLREIVRSGSVTALQQACQPLGKLLIQSVINTQGLAVISAFNAVCRVDDFACIPEQSIGHAIMTCTAQNRGAGRRDRMHETLRRGVRIALCYYPIICGAILLLKAPIMHLFAPAADAEMIPIGISYLSLKAFFYILPGLTNAIQGWFRGMDHMSVTLVSTLIQISLRTLCVYLLVPRIGMNGEAWGCLVGWSVMAVFEFGYYRRLTRKGVV